MGQSSSSDNSSPEHLIPDTVGVIQDEVLRHARVFSEIATLTYEEFEACLGQLNALSKRVIDSDGKQLVFAVKKGTDSTVLWKGTIRIACVKLDPETKVIDSYRLLKLNQFLKIFNTIQCQTAAAIQSSESENMTTSSCSKTNVESQIMNQSSRDYDSDSATSDDNVSSYQDSDTDSSLSKSTHGELSDTVSPGNKQKKKKCNINGDVTSFTQPLTASMLLEEVDSLAQCYGSNNEKLGECCICLERKPDVMLPCAHAYCMLCIEQWNTSHKTCPICRETLDSTDDTWVISDIPGSQEISEEICSALMKLTTTTD